MFNIGPLELMVLLVLALIVFGPAKLPELMASAGNAIREFQRASRELTSVFEETQSEFKSVMNIDDLMQSVELDATTNSPTAAYVPATSTVEEAIHTSVAHVSTTPSEYETAAGLIDPFESFEIPQTETTTVVAIPQAGPEEYATSAGLVEPPIPFDSAPDSVVMKESVEITSVPGENLNGFSNGHLENTGQANIAKSPADGTDIAKPVAVGRSDEKV